MLLVAVVASIEQKRKHYFESDLSKSNPDEIHMGLAKVDNPSNCSKTPRSRSCLLKRELDENKISYISYTSRLFLKQVSWLCQSKAAINSHKNNGQPQHIRSPAPQGLTFPPPWKTESNLFSYVFKTNGPIQMPLPFEKDIQNKHLMDFSHAI